MDIMKAKVLALAVAAILGLGGGAFALARAYGAVPSAARSAPVTQQLAAPKAENGAEVKDANEPSKEESATEQETKAEEQGDKDVPGGGHQDQDGADVDHQFEGVE